MQTFSGAKKRTRLTGPTSSYPNKSSFWPFLGAVWYVEKIGSIQVDAKLPSRVSQTRSLCLGTKATKNSLKLFQLNCLADSTNLEERLEAWLHYNPPKEECMGLGEKVKRSIGHYKKTRQIC